jgi:hypothetical protein
VSGGDWWDVADRPLAETIHVLDQLEEVERIDRLVAKGERLEMGYLMNAAFAGGEKGRPHPLQEANRRYVAELRRPVTAASVQALQDEKAAVADLLRAIREANARKDAGEPVPAEVS